MNSKQNTAEQNQKSTRQDEEAKKKDRNEKSPIANQNDFTDDEQAEREREVNPHMDDKVSDTCTHDIGPGVGGD